MDRSNLSQDDCTFIEAFETCAIGLADWSHRSHIRMAWIYLRLLPFDAALDAVRAGLNRFVRANAVPDSLERGYHETLTIAWMRLVASAMRHHGESTDSSAFCDSMPHLLCPSLTRVFYTRGRIISIDAKMQFIPPDLAALPD